MTLKPQDVLVLLKLIAMGQADWSYNRLAIELGMSSSEVHSAIKRALAAGLALQRADKVTPNVTNLQEFLIHGLRFAFIPERGEMTRGIPTLYAAAPLNSAFLPDGEPPPVWPDPQGEMRGMAFSPLYKSAPKAAQLDAALYELLVLIDAIRAGRARERAFAIKVLQQKLDAYAKTTESEPRNIDACC